ncbi:MAG: TatD family hydrolase [Propionibacteriaceae bacterium]|nr:TatD family hydrolase [Propionibacteriaceae bacterium]
MRVLDELNLPPLPEPLPRPVPDSHTHMDATTAYSGLSDDDSLRLAASVGVTKVVQVGCDVASSEWALAASQRHPNVVAAVALHPNDAARMVARGGDAALDEGIGRIAELAGCDGVRAVGETGLDYYRTRDEAGRRAQWRSFIAHIEIAVRRGRTLVIHDRDAHDDVLRALDLGVSPERIVMHCFSGDADHAAECLARDAWLSFPGVVTYKNAPELRQALLVTPPDKLLVETDAPYLTPVPARGRANAPYLLPHTVRFIAEQLDADLPSLCDQLAANTVAAFGGDWGV